MSLHCAKWLNIIGPGAVIASLSIGAGELIFSSRGGALFGYRILGPICLVCLFKWALVFATARHIVLSGAHPLQRWMELPGPRGWLPVTFLLLMVWAFPIWVAFHAATLGSLLSAVSGTRGAFHGADHCMWGLVVLAAVMVLVWTGGYQRLERLQLTLVAVMLACVCVSLALLPPDPREIWAEMFSITSLRYPEWITAYPEMGRRPLWVELTTYVGVIGGSGYDYLAYVSYLRTKSWGVAAGPIRDGHSLQKIADGSLGSYRQWLRAPLIDCSVSFLIVFVFSAVFVICGALILRPRQMIPAGSDLLTLQADFVASGLVGLRPVYFIGAFLAIFGTLYGTIEVAPAITSELLMAILHRTVDLRPQRRWVIGWVGLGGAAVMVVSLARVHFTEGKPPDLIAILTPANLFTGVLACGLIAGLSLWSDFRFLPAVLRPSPALMLMNVVGGGVFLFIGLKAYWDQAHVTAVSILFMTVVISAVSCHFINRRRKRHRYVLS